MHFQFQRRYNLLNVDETFAYLRKVHDNGDLEFVFEYSISQLEAVKREALTVNVSVFSRTIQRKPIIADSHRGHIDSKKLIRNVLTQMQDAKNAIKQQEEFTVAFRRSDITAKINNDVVGLLRAGVGKSNIQQLMKPVLKLVPSSQIKEANEAKPVLHLQAHASVESVHQTLSSSIAANTRALMHEMITREGKDPSHILQMTHRSIPSSDALGGILRRSRAPEVDWSPATRLLHHHVFHPESLAKPVTTHTVEDSTLVHVLSHEPQENVNVPVTIIVPRHHLRLQGRDNSHFFVKFELINGRSGVAVDVVTKPLDVARHVQLFSTPRRPPIVKATRSELSTRVNLEIKQIDRGATGVQIFKKTLHNAVTEIDDYALIGTYNLRHDQQSLLVQVDMPLTSTAIYRVVPIGAQGTQGFEYTNIVIKPRRFKPVKALSLTAQATDTGVLLEARHIPPAAVSIEFLARNVLIHEKNFRNVGGAVLLVDESARTADHLTTIDKEVSPGNIYEYVARIIYRDGHREQAGNAIVEFLQPVPGKVDTRTSDVVVEHAPEPNVRFTVATEVIDNNHDVIKSLLRRQDIYDLFKDDVLKEREFLKNLIAHNVQRVDLTTGRREDFGIVTAIEFNDAELRKNQAIQPLQLGHRYRYEITALLRAPETMFESLQKEKTDTVTKKVYTFNPAKFHHPQALTRGVIVTAAGLRTRFSKEAMSHGAIGSTEVIEVSFDDEPARIIDPAAARFDNVLNIITWKLQGSIDQVDHFVIMKEVHGVRTVIGKAHSEFPYGNCQYLHPVSRRDEGSLSYVIVPVFNDYKTGASATTNTVIVEGR